MLSDKPETKPFFIVGAQRSGTTMLRLMLNNHPRLCVPFESDFLKVKPPGPPSAPFETAAEARGVLDALADEPLTKKGNIVVDKDAVMAHPIHAYRDLLQAVYSEYARTKHKQRWGIKTPSYVTELDSLWQLFPGCKIVHIVRDGRDVAISHRNLSWGTRSIPRVAEDWRYKTILGRKMGGMIANHYLEIRFEDLVLEPTPVLTRVCEFLDEPFDAAMVRYDEDAKQEMPASSLQWHTSSVSKPDPSKVFAWKTQMSIPDQIIFQDIAGDVLDTFGYELVSHPAGLSLRLRRLYYTIVRRW